MQKGAIRTVAIVGDGKMGRSIFNHLLHYPLNIRWINITSSEADLNKVLKRLNRQLENGLMTEQAFREKAESIIISPELQAISGCDLLIEAIPEDLALKSELFAQVEQYLHDASIVTSNSSSILPQRFSLSETMQARFAGLHYFYPAETNTLLEIIPHPSCLPEHISTLSSFAEATGKFHILQNNITAFACNRYFLEIQSSLFCYCTDNKIDFQTLDNIISAELFPTGIFAMMEHIGFPILEVSVSNYLSSAISTIEVSRFLDALKSLNAKGMSRFPLNSVLKNSEPESRIIDFVNSLFCNFASEYIRREMFTAEQLKTVICEYTGSDYAPF